MTTHSSEMSQISAQKKNIYSHYYMASFLSRQGKSNPKLWLAIQVGKMKLSCSLGTTRSVLQEKFLWKPYNKSFIDSLFVQEAWIVASIFFCVFMGLDYVSVHKHAKKKKSNIQPSWSHTWSITHIYIAWWTYKVRPVVSLSAIQWSKHSVFTMLGGEKVENWRPK